MAGGINAAIKFTKRETKFGETTSYAFSLQPSAFSPQFSRSATNNININNNNNINFPARLSVLYLKPQYFYCIYFKMWL